MLAWADRPREEFPLAAMGREAGWASNFFTASRTILLSSSRPCSFRSLSNCLSNPDSAVTSALTVRWLDISNATSVFQNWIRPFLTFFFLEGHLVSVRQKHDCHDFKVSQNRCARRSVVANWRATRYCAQNGWHRHLAQPTVW